MVTNSFTKISDYARINNLSEEKIKFIKDISNKLHSKSLFKEEEDLEIFGSVFVDIFAGSAKDDTVKDLSELLFNPKGRSCIDGFISNEKNPSYNLTIVYNCLGIMIHHGILLKKFSAIVRALQNIPLGKKGTLIIESQSKKIKSLVKFEKNSSSIDYSVNHYFKKETIEFISNCCLNNLSAFKRAESQRVNGTRDLWAQEHEYIYSRNFDKSMMQITGYAEGSKLFTDNQVKFIEHVLTELHNNRFLVPGTNFYEFGICFVNILQWDEIYNKLFEKSSDTVIDGWIPFSQAPYFNLTALYALFGVFMHHGIIKKEHCDIIKSFDKTFWDGNQNSILIERSVPKFNLIAQLNDKGESFIDASSTDFLNSRSIEVLEININRYFESCASC